MVLVSRFVLLCVVTIAADPSRFASAHAAVEPGERDHFALASPLPGPITTAEVELRFVQEGGAGSGRVRVILTPESRRLTVLEARAAAQQAFLRALGEPGLGRPLTRITVVVQLAPAGAQIAGQEIIQFRHKGGRDWAVTAGE